MIHSLVSNIQGNNLNAVQAIQENARRPIPYPQAAYVTCFYTVLCIASLGLLIVELRQRLLKLNLNQTQTNNSSFQAVCSYIGAITMNCESKALKNLSNLPLLTIVLKYDLDCFLHSTTCSVEINHTE
jgi:hypothetical protein